MITLACGCVDIEEPHFILANVGAVYSVLVLMAWVGVGLFVWDFKLYKAPWRKTPRCPKCACDLSSKQSLERKPGCKNEFPISSDFKPVTCRNCGEVITDVKQAYCISRTRHWMAARVIICLTLIYGGLRFYAEHQSHLERVEQNEDIFD